MLTDEELQALFDARGTPDLGRARIRQIRDSLPSRAVKTNKMSGKARYAAIKMPFVIEAEAGTTEYAAMVEYDHDENILEFYPQPEPLVITYLVRDTTRRTTIPTTPDCFRISKSSFTFVECKREEELMKLAQQMPNRYQRTEQGGWRSPPAERAAAEFGCLFEVRSSAQNNWTLLENMELLKDYYLGELPPIPSEFKSLLLERLNKEGWVSAFDLIHMEPSIPADALYSMIRRHDVFFPLKLIRLADQERALIFRDELTFQAHSTFLSVSGSTPNTDQLIIRLEADDQFTWDGEIWQVINPGEKQITIQRLSAEEGKKNLAEITYDQVASLVREKRVTVHRTASRSPVDCAEELLRDASPSSIKEANYKYEILFSTPKPTNPLVKRGMRMKAYWLHSYRKSELQYGNGFVGLLSRRSGNRKSKASLESLAFANEIIVADWETIRRKMRRTSHGKYCNKAREQGLQPVSYVTFCDLVKKRAGHKQKESRVGEKAAYDLEPQYLEIEYTTPRHGVRAWHIGHIDHTPLPLKFVHSKLGEIVATIWLTFLLDANTRRVVAYYLSFDEPSYRSCMMVLRDCVRRHNRVHQIIVCDQGSEFNSIYWEQLLAMVRTTKKERRAGKPKEGSVVERVFKTTLEQFVTNLLGSTDIVEQYFRSISPEVDPTRHAIWTLDRFDKGMQKYLDEVYHKNHHAGIGMSPDEAWALSLRSHGSRDHLLIPYGQSFIAWSCPAVHRGTAKITPQGIKINYRWFKSDVFLLPGMLGQQVPARYDPFNQGVAYAYVGDEWHPCKSEYFAIFSKYSERAIRLATERLHLMDRVSGRKAAINSERLAIFLESQEGEEALSIQARNDAEAQAHRTKITGQPPNLAEATPGALPPIERYQIAMNAKLLEDL